MHRKKKLFKQNQFIDTEIISDTGNDMFSRCILQYNSNTLWVAMVKVKYDSLKTIKVFLMQKCFIMFLLSNLNKIKIQFLSSISHILSA